MCIPILRNLLLHFKKEKRKSSLVFPLKKVLDGLW